MFASAVITKSGPICDSGLNSDAIAGRTSTTCQKHYVHDLKHACYFITNALKVSLAESRSNAPSTQNKKKILPVIYGLKNVS